MISTESLEAFASGDKQRSRFHVLEYVRSCRERGATVDECSVLLGVPPNAVSGRFTELHRAGAIVKIIDPDGKPLRRMTRAGCSASVYVASEFVNPAPSPVVPPPRDPVAGAHREVESELAASASRSDLTSESQVSLFGDLSPERCPD